MTFGLGEDRADRTRTTGLGFAGTIWGGTAGFSNGLILPGLVAGGDTLFPVSGCVVGCVNRPGLRIALLCRTSASNFFSAITFTSGFCAGGGGRFRAGLGRPTLEALLFPDQLTTDAARDRTTGETSSKLDTKRCVTEPERPREPLREDMADRTDAGPVGVVYDASDR